MDLVKAMMIGAVLSVTIAVVIGVQGGTAGALAIKPVTLGEARLFWSFPLFFSASGVFYALALLQR